MSRVVSVQDISCLGQCSLTVALPVLSAFGVETAILPSGILSTHTGCFKNYTYHDLTDEMPKIVNHWREEGITFDAIYTGYIGDARQFELIKGMKDMLNPGGKLIVDPAMADFGRLYPALGEDIVEGMKGLVSQADMILPNLTEAAFLLDRECKEIYSKEETEEMIRALAELGPNDVILTGVSYEEGKIGAAAYNKCIDEFETYFTDRVPKTFHGTGDVFSSVAIAEYINGKRMSEVIKSACDFVMESIAYTLPDEKHIYGVNFEKALAKKDKY